MANEARNFRLSKVSSIALASPMVQVITDARARLKMTA
jgi:hypothetical protein